MATNIASRLTTEIASRPRLVTEDAIKYLLEQYGIPVAKSTLKTWAWRGGGPGFQKSGQRRLYPIEQLDEWAEQRLTPVVASTSELTSLRIVGRRPEQAIAQSRAPIPDRTDARAGAVKDHARHERPPPPPGDR